MGTQNKSRKNWLGYSLAAIFSMSAAPALTAQKQEAEKIPTATPSDVSIRSNQWHVSDDATPDIYKHGFNPPYNLELDKVWEDYSGKGCTVGIFEHEPKKGFHATQVDILITAGHNSKKTGGGVAPDSHRVILDSTDSANSANRFRFFDVTNNSWAYTNPYTSSFDLVLNDSSPLGRNGLGTLTFKAAGNDGALSYRFTSPWQMSTNIITIGNANANGGINTSSTKGSFVFAAAPGTDIKIDGYGSVSGTSFASPLAAGIGCHILESNPNIGYRDVQAIYAASAMDMPAQQKNWRYPHYTNQAKNWNGGGYTASEDSGFGLVNARTAVRLAEVWPRHNPQTQTNVQKLYGSFGKSIELKGSKASANAGTTALDLEFQERENIETEWVVLEFEGLTYMQGQAYTLNIISPSGTKIPVFHAPKEQPVHTKEKDEKESTAVYTEALTMKNGQITIKYKTATPYFWGEEANGLWFVQMERDGQGPSDAQLSSWSLRITGKKQETLRQHIYTDDYQTLAQKDQRRQILFIPNEDRHITHILNAAATSKNTPVSLYLDGKQESYIGDVPLYLPEDLISEAYGGDGNDIIVGSDKIANKIIAGRGDDIVAGKGQANIYVFRHFDGHDIITPAPDGQDVLSLGPKINKDDLIVKTFNNDALISFKRHADASVYLPEYNGKHTHLNVHFQSSGETYALSDLMGTPATNIAAAKSLKQNVIR